MIQILNEVDHSGSHLSKDEEQGQGGGEDDEGVGEDVQDERGGPAQLRVGRPLRNTCVTYESSRVQLKMYLTQYIAAHC